MTVMAGHIVQDVGRKRVGRNVFQSKAIYARSDKPFTHCAAMAMTTVPLSPQFDGFWT